jgi:hypothetical protein
MMREKKEKKNNKKNSESYQLTVINIFSELDRNDTEVQLSLVEHAWVDS